MTSKELVIPDYLKNMMDGQQSDASALIGGSISVPRISLKGRKFRFIVDGEEVESTTDPITVIILGVQPDAPRLMSKTYYKGKYNPDDSGPPDCSSSDGIRPDSWVGEPTSESCSSCEMNKWGSATSLKGKRAKACRDSKRLYIVKADEIENGTIYILNVTVSSLKAVSEYGSFLAQHNAPMAAAITQISMADSDFPQIEFDFIGMLKEKHGKLAIGRSQAKEWTTPTAPLINAPVQQKALPTADESTSEPQAKADQVDTVPASDVSDLLDNWDSDIPF